MKNYLTAREMNDLLYVSHLLEINSKTVESWQEHNNMTKEEGKYLRTAITYTEKFMKTLLSRMPEKEIDKFMKRTIRAQKEPVRILDKWMMDRVFGSYETEYEIVKVERPEFEKLAYLAINNHCKDCERNYSKCELYDILENNLVPRCEMKNNCAYAFISEEAKKRAEEKKKAKLESKGKESKRKSKKKANRFDVDQEEYTYNFISRRAK